MTSPLGRDRPLLDQLDPKLPDISGQVVDVPDVLPSSVLQAAMEAERQRLQQCRGQAFPMGQRSASER